MNVTLHLDRNNPDQNRLVLDGQDITPHVLAAGLSLTYDVAINRPLLHLTLRPTVLDLDGDLDIQALLHAPDSAPEPAVDG